MKRPSFQFYPADFLADENVALMSNQELGCYIKLICYCWREGSIPSDPNKIARLCGENGSTMAELWLAIKPCFDPVENDDSRMTQKRLIFEKTKQDEFKKERSEAGKRGAQSRWKAKDNSANSSAIAQPIAESMAKNGFSSSSSCLDLLDPKDHDSSPKGDGLKKTEKTSAGFDAFWAEWPAGRRVEKKKTVLEWKRQNLENNFEAIVRAVKAQKKHGGALDISKGVNYVPHPHRWLENQRFNDELPSENQNGSIYTVLDLKKMEWIAGPNGYVVRGFDIQEGDGGFYAPDPVFKDKLKFYPLKGWGRCPAHLVP